MRKTSCPFSVDFLCLDSNEGELGKWNGWEPVEEGGVGWSEQCGHCLENLYKMFQIVGNSKPRTGTYAKCLLPTGGP